MKRVLEKALKEINELTDISAKYIAIKKGNKVVKLDFKMKKKTTEEQNSSNLKVYEVLGDIK